MIKQDSIPFGCIKYVSFPVYISNTDKRVYFVAALSPEAAILAEQGDLGLQSLSLFLPGPRITRGYRV